MFSVNVIYFMVQYGGFSSGYHVYILTRRTESLGIDTARHESRRKNYSGKMGEPAREGDRAGKRAQVSTVEFPLGGGSSRNRFAPHLPFLWASPKSLI